MRLTIIILLLVSILLLKLEKPKIEKHELRSIFVYTRDDNGRLLLESYRTYDPTFEPTNSPFNTESELTQHVKKEGV